MKLHQTFRLDEEVIQAANEFVEKQNKKNPETWSVNILYRNAIVEYLTARGQKIKKPSTKR